MVEHYQSDAGSRSPPLIWLNYISFGQVGGLIPVVPAHVVSADFYAGS